MKRKKAFSTGIVIIWLVFAAIVHAGHLPGRIYTTADGLVNDGINKIVRDSRGFLWFCTNEGLSRFDGFVFKNYTQSEGLPHRNINDFLETKSGDFLIATNAGLAILNPNGKAYHWDFLTSTLEKTSNEPPLFETFEPPGSKTYKKLGAFLSLAEDHDGTIYAGTAKALFRVEKSNNERTFHEIESTEWDDNTEFSVLKFDSANYLWIVASSGIFRMSPEGAIQNFHQDGGGSMLIDNDGKIWIGGSGTDSGLRIFSVSDDGKSASLTKTYRRSDGLPEEKSMLGITQTSSGRIFILIGTHLCEFLPQAKENEIKFRVVEDGSFQTLEEDAGGNIWLGTVQDGVLKLALSGFIRYDERDGAPTKSISSLGTDVNGNLFFTQGLHGISLFDGEKFETVEPPGLKSRNWGNSLLDLQDERGEWWIPSIDGLLHYPKTKNLDELGKTQPIKNYTQGDGLSGNAIFNIFEDSRENIWISSSGKSVTLQFFEPKKGTIHRFGVEDGLPESNGAVAFDEDGDGNIWIGFYYSGLARYKNGQFQFFTAKDGLPDGSINSIFVDRSKRLWIATSSRGIFRSDYPSAANPTFTNISTNEGLSSNRANCVTEDDFGNIYIGTGRGINRIDPVSGNIKLFTRADGLPGSVIQFCRRDAGGALWFGSQNSLVKFIPQTETSLKPPPIYIGAFSVNGIDQPISTLGAERVENPRLNSDQHQIRIDFFALGFNAGDRLRYQYKLNDQDWHAPEDIQSLNLNLASGDYEVFVRAVNADNVVSENPATVSFSIAFPFWQHWWFRVLAALCVIGILLSVERSRAARLRELRNAFGKLSVSENRFRQMIEQSPLGTVIFAPDGSILSINRAYEDFWGIRFEQIKNWDFFADEQIIKTGVAEKMQRVFSGESVRLPPTAYDPQTNSAGLKIDEKMDVRWIQSFAYPVKNDAGELLEVILVMEDVTDRKRADEIEQTAKSERLRELEQVRRRIASDLHDDIGSSLTQISIWSEVLQRDISKQNGEIVSEPLKLIGNSSRELVDAMSDIVWAINPEKDFLSELSRKMRRFAADIFTARNIEFTFDPPQFTEELAIGANLRREVFLIFKEAINNIVKHSKCRIVAIDFRVENADIYLTLRDDGTGFDILQNTSGGHGLSNMKTRAEGLGGTLEIVSGKSGGTITNLVAPLIVNAG